MADKRSVAPHRRDESLSHLAKSIANSVEELGAACTARLLADIAIGLAAAARSSEPAEDRLTTHRQTVGSKDRSRPGLSPASPR